MIRRVKQLTTEFKKLSNAQVSETSKMASILGVIRKISDTIRPIWMKLWGYIEFTLKLCNVIFSTSGLDLETGNGNFSENPTITPCKIFLEIPDFLDTEIFPN